MKKIFTLVILSFSIPLAIATEVQVRGMIPEANMERSFELQTSLPERVVLDCQSFIQGLNIGPDDTFLLDPEECESLQERIYDSLIQSKLHCLDIESDIRSDYVCH
jgi:hypothetical protein